MLRLTIRNTINYILFARGGRAGGLQHCTVTHTCTDRLIVNKNAKDLYIISCCCFIEPMIVRFVFKICSAKNCAAGPKRGCRLIGSAALETSSSSSLLQAPKNCLDLKLYAHLFVWRVGKVCTTSRHSPATRGCHHVCRN